MKRPNLTLLHGWGTHARVFDPWLERLESRFQPHAPPLPGYAQSPWPAGRGFDFELERMASELPDGALLGWSLGGLYAIELCRRRPDKFGALVLVACNPCFVTRADWPCAVQADVFEGFARELAAERARTLKRFLALQLQGGEAQRELARSLWRTISDAGEPADGVLESGLDLLRRHDARTSLSRLCQPVTLVLGTRDRLVPFALGRQIDELRTGIRVESVAGAAHAPFLSHPELVSDFL